MYKDQIILTGEANSRNISALTGEGMTPEDVQEAAEALESCWVDHEEVGEEISILGSWTQDYGRKLIATIQILQAQKE